MKPGRLAALGALFLEVSGMLEGNSGDGFVGSDSARTVRSFRGSIWESIFGSKDE